ncbi:MAG TPA: GTP-binding protein, partial [Anaerolineales bacterium]|nr:GTP-binding protein [Anaerolineales bacterium]
MIRVVGTAGHVDHGKSALVEALTGTHPDRLREERERAMTIDLGFAWLTLDDGTEVGIVDVPGHRDFVDNMLAGAGGFQAAILVVAADEGVMPQTREHVAILDLLEIPRLVVALTKMDTVDDLAWAQLVEEDVRRLLTSTAYARSPVVQVSVRSGQGLGELRRRLAEELAQAPAPRDLGRPRLPIDRSFVMSGFGTVVTGTLLD